MEQVLNSRFHSFYALVISVAIYAGTYFACFYWPSFIGYILFPQQINQIEAIAGVLFLPLGLVGLAIRSGLKMCGLHFLLALIAVGTSVSIAVAIGRDSELEFVRNLVMLSMFVAYIIAAILGWRRRISIDINQA